MEKEIMSGITEQEHEHLLATNTALLAALLAALTECQVEIELDSLNEPRLESLLERINGLIAEAGR